MCKSITGSRLAGQGWVSDTDCSPSNGPENLSLILTSWKYSLAKLAQLVPRGRMAAFLAPTFSILTKCVYRFIYFDFEFVFAFECEGYYSS